jgi:hypothetical protein
VIPARRAAFIAGSLIAAAAIAYVWTRPAGGERATLATRTSPDAAGPALTASGIPIAMPAGAASTARVPASAPAGVGAEAAIADYGQFVLAALDGGTAQQAGRAAQLISNCGVVDLARTSIETLKSAGQMDERIANRVIDETDQRGRRCQSLTDDMKSRAKELAERAVAGGAKGVGTIYGEAVHFDPPEPMRQPLIDALRGDFLDGDPYSARTLGLRGQALGLSKVEAHAYRIAYETLAPIILPAIDGDDPPLTDQEQREAAALAAAWVDQVRKAHPPAGG